MPLQNPTSITKSFQTTSKGPQISKSKGMYHNRDFFKKVLKDGPPGLQMTVGGTHPYLPQAPLLPRGPSNVLPGCRPPPRPRSRSRCGGSAALCAHTPSIGGTLWGRKSTKGCRREGRSRRQQRCSGRTPGDPCRGPGLGKAATHGDQSPLPHSPSPGYPQQRLGRQEGEHTLHHLREVTQHVGTSRVS